MFANGKGVAGFVTSFWSSKAASQLQRTNRCFIHRLPLDIMVDEIFVYMHLEDILALRRVDKYFFLLTHEPIIWKRFLSKTNVPIPPIRPTFQYTAQATDFEIEQLVSRAISLEDNWRRKTPYIKSTTRFPVHYDILEMKLLPGGKYLIASVRAEQRFYVVLYCIDHPNGPHSLARFPTQMKAYDLQAKYMTYHGEPVIMIAYIRRSRREQDAQTPMADLNGYASASHYPIDDTHPIITELICVKINLEIVESIANPYHTPSGPEASLIALRNSSKGPFQMVMTTPTASTRNHPKFVSLYMMDDQPHIAFVRGTTTIASVNIEDGSQGHQMVCLPNPIYAHRPHTIKAICPLPAQRQILVVRSIGIVSQQTEKPVNLVEIFPLVDHNPVELVSRHPPADTEVLLNNEEIERAYVSDYVNPAANRDFDLPEDRQPLPPLSIYLELKEPCGVIHHHLWPSVATIRGERQWMYSCRWLCVQTRHMSPEHITRVLPGGSHAFMFTIHKDDRRAEPFVFHFRRYISPEWRNQDYPHPRVDRMSPILRKKIRDVPRNAYSTVYISQDAFEHYLEHGLAAITWDESIGRICVSSGKDQMIEVSDFANVVHPDSRFEQWKLAHSFV